MKHRQACTEAADRLWSEEAHPRANRLCNKLTLNWSRVGPLGPCTAIFHPSTTFMRLQDTLVNSVVKRMMSDAPLGVLLSGGLDSSLVASIAQKCGLPSLHVCSLLLASSAVAHVGRTTFRLHAGRSLHSRPVLVSARWQLPLYSQSQFNLDTAMLPHVLSCRCALPCAGTKWSRSAA